LFYSLLVLSFPPRGLFRIGGSADEMKHLKNAWNIGQATDFLKVRLRSIFFWSFSSCDVVLAPLYYSCHCGSTFARGGNNMMLMLFSLGA
jgi:hypothetical protein